jgi:hypothetical protein
LTEALRNVFHVFGQCKQTVNSGNGPNDRNHTLFNVIFCHGCFRYLISGGVTDTMLQ